MMPGSASIPANSVGEGVEIVAQNDCRHRLERREFLIDGRHPMRRDTIFRVASLSKPVVAVAALIYSRVTAGGSA